MDRSALGLAALGVVLGIYSIGFGLMLLLFDARILVLWPAGSSPSGINFSADRIFPFEVSFFLGAGVLAFASGAWAMIRVFRPGPPGPQASK